MTPDDPGRSAEERLRRHLLADIEADRLQPGDRLGSERALAERYQVSRGTLRQVLSALSEAGIVDRVAGRAGGTFLSRPKVERDMGSIVGLPHYLARQGFSTESTVLEARITSAGRGAGEALGLAPEALVFVIRRLRMADRLPLSLELVHLPADRFPRLLEQSLGGSLYELLDRQYQARPSEAVESIEVAQSTTDEAALLGVEEGASLLLVRRVSYDEDGAALEYSKDLFRGDRTRISVRTSGRGIRSKVHSEDGRVELSN